MAEPEYEFETRNIKHDFSEDELKGISERLAEKMGNIEDLEATKKKIADDYTTEIKSANKLCRLLALNVRNGYEYRDIECIIQMDYKDGVVRFLDPESGKELDKRPMLPHEKQMEIPEDGKDLVDEAADRDLTFEEKAFDWVNDYVGGEQCVACGFFNTDDNSCSLVDSLETDMSKCPALPDEFQAKPIED